MKLSTAALLVYFCAATPSLALQLGSPAARAPLSALRSSSTRMQFGFGQKEKEEEPAGFELSLPSLPSLPSLDSADLPKKIVILGLLGAGPVTALAFIASIVIFTYAAHGHTVPRPLPILHDDYTHAITYKPACGCLLPLTATTDCPAFHVATSLPGPGSRRRSTSSMDSIRQERLR